MTTPTLTANRHLAEQMGWTNITEAGGALLGMPPWAAPNSRGQAAVPNWAGDWRECGPLMTKHGCWPQIHKGRILVGLHREPGRLWNLVYWATADVGPDDSIDDLLLPTVVAAVCAKLEAGQ